MPVLLIVVNNCSALNCRSGYSGETKDPNITDTLTVLLICRSLNRDLFATETFYNVDIQFFYVTKRLN